MNNNELNRRRFIGGTGVAGIALMAGLKPIYAQAAGTIRIGFISPRTGPLGGFGETDGHVLDLVRGAVSGGIEAAGARWEVEVLDRDTQSDPSRAGQLARDLINNQSVDLMLVVSTPETINPVSDACEAAGVPCISTVMPWQAWYFGRGAKPGEPSPFRWTWHFGFGVEEYGKAYVSQWNSLETNRKVGVMYPNDADGNAVRESLLPLLIDGGYTIIDPGAYETGTTDFSTQIALFRSEGIEIFNAFPSPPDFAAFWRQAAQQGLTRQIKICQIAKAALFPSNIEVLGSLGPRIASDAYWHRDFPYASPITGLGSRALADGYEAASGRQWTQQLGASMSVFDVGLEALKASSNPKSRADVAAAISALRITSTTGPVDFTSGPVANVSPGPIIGTQWIPAEGGPFKFDFVVTENATDPNVPVANALLPYNS